MKDTYHMKFIISYYEPRANGSASKNCINEIAVSDGAIYKGRHRIGNRSAKISFDLNIAYIDLP